MSSDWRARPRPDRTNRRSPSALASDGRSLTRLAARTRPSEPAGRPRRPEGRRWGRQLRRPTRPWRARERCGPLTGPESTQP
eukprot:12656399-Alexandrium_andersonii.AAC.1